MRHVSVALLALALLLAQPLGVRASDGRPHVCLDPGHGGSDPGAVRGALVEKSLTLDVAQRLRDLLEPTYNVRLTRTDDATTLGNSDRAKICNAFAADVVLSIHFNASSDAQVDYAWFFYGKRIKDEAFTRVMNDAYQLPNAYGTGPLPKKPITNFANGTLLRSTAPATLVETLFMSHVQEQVVLGDGTGARQQAVATELAKGIQAWFGR